MLFVNLTPHAVTIGDRVFPASGKLARVKVSQSNVCCFDGIQIVVGTYGAVEGLPEEEAGTMYIVSALVRSACPTRRDLASPANLVRDRAGQIIGCSALEINPRLT